MPGALPASQSAVPARAPPPVAIQAGEPHAPPGSVWECVVNGQRTFSDAPCGIKAMIRPLSEINRMDATPVYPAVSYQPRYPDYYPDDDAAPADPDATNSVNNVYIRRHGVSMDDQRRHEHPKPPHHPNPPHQHDHGSPKRN
jgi:hypothetical protein